MKALLVIDMQQGSFTAATPRYNTPAVVSRINELAAAFREHSFKVVFIQHDGTAHNDFLPDTAAWALLPELEQHTSDVYIAKTANDCFYRSQLDAFLKDKGIIQLVITGCATDFCVDATVKSALARDYEITVIEDAHTTADRPGIDALQVIGHYNWIWQNMIPTGGNLKVAACAAYLEQL